jgi:hypothetical protein
LLTIENVAVWSNAIDKFYTFDWMWLKIEIGISRLQHHNSADGVREQEAGVKTPNMRIIPYPTTLKFWKLGLAF